MTRFLALVPLLALAAPASLAQTSPAALDFDGADDIVMIDDNPALDFGSGDFTVEFWVYKQSAVNVFNHIMGVGKWYSGGFPGTNEWLLSVGTEAGVGEYPSFYVDGPAGIYSVQSTIPIALNTWHHLAGVRAGDELQIYVDGALAGTAPLPAGFALSNPDRPITVGAFSDGTRATDARFDEVRVWNMARTQTQIDASRSTSLRGDEAGLVSYHRFDEGSGQTVYDATGRHPGRIGVYTYPDGADPAWVTPGSPVPAAPASPTSALAFDGVDDRVVFGDVFDLLGQSFTLETWFKTSVQGPRSIVFKHAPGYYNGYFIAVNQSGGYGLPGKVWCYSAGAEPTIAVSTTTVTDGEWHHVACVFDQAAGEKRVYVDGVLEGTGPIPSTLNNDAPFSVGGFDVSGYRESFPGAVDEVRVWGTARTDEEIAATQYLRLNGAETGLLALYRMDEGSGQVVTDAVGTTQGQLGTTAGADGNDPAWIAPGVDLVGEVEAVTLHLTGAKGWRTLSAAFPGTSFHELLGPLFTRGYPGSDRPRNRKPSVLLYDETVDPATDPADLDGYVPPASASADIPMGRGLYVYTWLDQDRDRVNEGFPDVLQTGEALAPPFVFDVTYTSTGDAMDGWNLLGNPFATAMEWDKLVRTDVAPTVYVYDPNHPGGAQYRTWTTGAGGTMTSDKIAPNQGFFVQATGGSPALRAPRGSRSSSGPFYGLRADDEPVLALDLRLEGALADTLYGTATRMVFRESLGETASAKASGVSGAYELASPARAGLTLAVATDEALLDVAVLPASGRVEVPLAVGAVQDGRAVPADLALTWPGLAIPSGWRVVLNDRATGAEVDLRETSRYAFSARPVDLLAVPSGDDPEAPPAPRPLLIGPDRTVADARFVLVAEATGHPSPQTEAPRLALAPNPASTTARVRFTLGEAGPVRLAVHDALGREVAVLDAGVRQPGAHEVALDATGMAPGVYIVRLGTESGRAMVQLTVVR